MSDNFALADRIRLLIFNYKHLRLLYYGAYVFYKKLSALS